MLTYLRTLLVEDEHTIANAIKRSSNIRHIRLTSYDARKGLGLTIAKGTDDIRHTVISAVNLMGSGSSFVIKPPLPENQYHN